MKELKFTQIYHYGDNWDAILQVPDDAVCKMISGDKGNFEEWVIIFKNNDFDENITLNDGCCQVMSYLLDDIVILTLDNVITDNWVDDGDKINNMVSGLYIYNYKINTDDVIKKIENNIKIGIEDIRTLIGALKVKSVFDRDYLSCKCVRKDPNNGEIITFDSDGLFSLTWIDDMIHNGETYIISRDGTIFDSCVEELINNLKK